MASRTYTHHGCIPAAAHVQLATGITCMDGCSIHSQRLSFMRAAIRRPVALPGQSHIAAAMPTCSNLRVYDRCVSNVRTAAELSSGLMSGVVHRPGCGRSSQASKNRSVASTNLNRASSRSHAILTVTVTLTDPMENKSAYLYPLQMESDCLARYSAIWQA